MAIRPKYQITTLNLEITLIRSITMGTTTPPPLAQRYPIKLIRQFHRIAIQAIKMVTVLHFHQVILALLIIKIQIHLLDSQKFPLCFHLFVITRAIIYTIFQTKIIECQINSNLHMKTINVLLDPATN